MAKAGENDFLRQDPVADAPAYIPQVATLPTHGRMAAVTGFEQHGQVPQSQRCSPSRRVPQSWHS